MIKNEKIADAIDRNFTSPNEPDSNLEPANIVDAVFKLSRSINNLGNANAATEMGGMEALGKSIIDSADRIALSIDGLAHAIRGKG